MIPPSVYSSQRSALHFVIGPANRVPMSSDLPPDFIQS